MLYAPHKGDRAMNNQVLQALERRAKETQTTALLIWQDGQIISSFGADTKVPLYSLTKSFVSLAIGFLVDEGKITTLDAPVKEWFSDREDFCHGAKASITLRMLMTHTSGIEDHFVEPDNSFNVEKCNAFRQVPDVLEAALKLRVIKPPGTHASYSNASADILVALVQRISGRRIDAYLQEKLFAPLGISGWEWVSSTKQLFGSDDDRPSGADGLVLTANDLLKVGQMILQHGQHAGKQLLSKAWIERMSSEIPAPSLTIELGEKAATYTSSLLWMVPAALAGLKRSKVFMGWGFLGQYFMLFPKKKRLAVRLYTEGLPSFTDPEKNQKVSFCDFEYWARSL